MPAFEIPVVDTTGAGDGFTAGLLHQLIKATDQWQSDFIDLEGYDDPMPRGHLQPAKRIDKALEDKNLAADVVVYGQAVGGMTCMEEGAIAAQPSARLADKFAQVYGESLLVTEEDRKFEMPDMDKPWLKWQFTR
jgi:fructokinase